MKAGAFVMYPGPAVLLNFRAEFWQNLIHNGHTLARFQPFEYEESYSTVHIIHEQKCSGNVTIIDTSELVASESFIARTKVSIGLGDKMKVVHSRMRLTSDGFYRYHDQGFKVTTSKSISWSLVPCVVLYCYDIAGGKTSLVCSTGRQ